jgi:hypothetical protein
MPYKLLKPVTPEMELALPKLRWRRGQVVDVDPEYLPALEALAPVEEISREDAAEVVVDVEKPGRGGKAAEKVREEPLVG